MDSPESPRNRYYQERSPLSRNEKDELAIFQRYNIDTMFPQIWIEEQAQPSQQNDPSSPADTIPLPPPPPMAPMENFDDSDPLGLKPSVLNDSARQARRQGKNESVSPQIIITSRAFDAKKFLAEVHGDASYKDLQEGLYRLQSAAEQRTEILRLLVRDYFDQFVTAKSTMDDVCREMKSEHLKEETAYGTESFAETLAIVTQTANQIYGPILEKRARAEKIKTTLAMLERFKFYFNLPKIIQESIRKNKYDIAVRDYKKGKVLLQSLFPDILPSSDFNSSLTPIGTSPASPNKSAQLDVNLQQKKVFERVWAEVEKFVVLLREKLFHQLTDHRLPLEVQETVIIQLLELDVPNDPVWHYLESRYKWIIQQLTDKFNEHVRSVEVIKDSFENLQRKSKLPGLSAEPEKSTSLSVSQFRKAIALRANKEYELAFAKDIDLQNWRATSRSVKALSATLTQTLPDFWKISKSYVEGKYSKGGKDDPKKATRQRGNVDMKKIDQCHQMVRQVIEFFSKLISHIFDIPLPTETPASTSSSASSTPSTPTNAPPRVTTPQIQLPSLPALSTKNPITTAFYVSKIMPDLINCFNDVKGIKMSAEAINGLVTVMNKIKVRLIQMVRESWMKESVQMYQYEDWTSDPDIPEITNLLKLFLRFQRHMMRVSCKVASSLIVVDDTMEPQTISPAIMETIKATFLESSFVFLDGLHELVFEWKSSGNIEEQSKRSNWRVDMSRIDCRLLVTLCNVQHIKTIVFPNLLDFYVSLFDEAIAEESKRLLEAVDKLDSVFFNDYIKRKNLRINEIVNSGILFEGVNWLTIPKPLEVRPYAYNALLEMVLTHAEVSTVSKNLVGRVLSELLNNLGQALLDAFRKVERFGLGGILQATLEVEFIHQTLSLYETPISIELFQLAYSTITRGWIPDEDPTTAKQKLTSELSNVKDILAECKKKTAVQFLCFRQ